MQDDQEGAWKSFGLKHRRRERLSRLDKRNIVMPIFYSQKPFIGAACTLPDLVSTFDMCRENYTVKKRCCEKADIMIWQQITIYNALSASTCRDVKTKSLFYQGLSSFLGVPWQSCKWRIPVMCGVHSSFVSLHSSPSTYAQEQEHNRKFDNQPDTACF